ncbi:zinc ribbon domain-containing protein [Companilactobacillus mishanensis]|uniref:zinc ribbon domain-containing protein n=1 Tax=Companilactobacillus mishanensis TaxID=2486008 RepID=UPI00129796AB|nr:zinc ribbon domain-containing protein [Companilactobacillus mishanensis]MQS89944.1 zinc ribbon domain-containing protein [Companilactobacillus mishanensis]
MKYCTNCGAEIPDGVKFCPNCGTKVEALTAPANEKATEPTPQSQNTVDKVASNQSTSYQQQTQKSQPVQAQQAVTSQNSDQTTTNDKSQEVTLSKYVKSNKNKLWKTLAIVAVAVIVLFLLFTRTSKYRDMTTSNEDKINKVIQWEGEENVLPFSTTTTLQDHTFIIAPNQGHSILSDVIRYFTDEGVDASSVEQYLIKISSKIQHEYGSGYKIKLGDTNDDSQYIMEVQNGKVISDNLR